MAQRFDAIDRRILQELQRNGRISVSDLADKVGLSPSPCLRRLRILEKSHVISRYTAVLNQDQIGLTVSAIVKVKLDRRPRSEALAMFSKEVAKWTEVLECYLMSGEADYYLHVVVADLTAYQHFLKSKITALDYVTSVESSFILERVKWGTAVPIA
jgi:Lrp/AsnC family transcriptional regulator, leucine-responsive regulatory protein